MNYQENPVLADYMQASWEVFVIVFGSLLLGLILGYLIWGTLRRRILQLKERLAGLEQEVLEKDNRIAMLAQQLESEIEMRKSALRRYDLVRSRNVALYLRTFEMAEEQGRKSEVSSGGISVASGGQQVAPGQGLEQTPPYKPTESGEMLPDATDILGLPVRENDFSIFFGIDDAATRALKSRGIVLWEKLAGAQAPLLRVILEELGLNASAYRLKTWPKQARMAAAGEWKKLKLYQEKLKKKVDR